MLTGLFPAKIHIQYTEFLWESKFNFLVFLLFEFSDQQCISKLPPSHAARWEQQQQANKQHSSPRAAQMLTYTSSLDTQTGCHVGHPSPWLNALTQQRRLLLHPFAGTTHFKYLSLQGWASSTISWENLHKGGFDQPCIYCSFIRPIHKTNI